MHYYKNRYYLAEIGRFVTRDLIGVWGDYYNFGNGYAYVGCSSLNYSDKLGLHVSIDPHRSDIPNPWKFRCEPEMGLDCCIHNAKYDWWEDWKYAHDQYHACLDGEQLSDAIGWGSLFVATGIGLATGGAVGCGIGFGIGVTAMIVAGATGPDCGSRYRDDKERLWKEREEAYKRCYEKYPEDNGPLPKNGSTFYESFCTLLT